MNNEIKIIYPQQDTRATKQKTQYNILASEKINQDYEQGYEYGRGSFKNFKISHDAIEMLKINFTPNTISCFDTDEKELADVLSCAQEENGLYSISFSRGFWNGILHETREISPENRPL